MIWIIIGIIAIIAVFVREPGILIVLAIAIPLGFLIPAIAPIILGIVLILFLGAAKRD